MNEIAPPTPGLALVMATKYVSALDAGPRDGGRWCGTPLSVSASSTQFRRPDGVVMRLPNSGVTPVSSLWVSEAFQAGVNPFVDSTGWEWLRWTVADHAEVEPIAEAKPLVFVACGATKLTVRSRAAELYVGTYFRLALRAARRLVPDDRIRIVSALHGIVPLHWQVDPYNVRLGDVGAITAQDLRTQARAAHLHKCSDVTVLAGKGYANLIQQVWPNAAAPLAGTRGIGEQQHRLNTIAC